MKIMVKLLLCLSMVFCLFGCGEGTPKCEHTNTTVSYEIDGLSIRKHEVCNDCGEEISKATVNKVQYVYDKELFNENGIRCSLLSIEVDGWGTVTMKFEVEGTSEKKRTVSLDKLYINGYEDTIWVYVSELANNKKSLEDNWITTIKGEDFLKGQDYEAEINYSIMDSSSYSTLSEKEVTLNLNEYTSVKEMTE